LNHLEISRISQFFFADTNGEENGIEIGNTVAEMLTTALIQTNRFQILERSQLDKILQEHALGLSGALDEETAIDVGHLIGVDAIVVGSAGKLKSQIELDARIVNALDGKAHVAANASAFDESQLRNAANELARKLALNAEKIPIKRSDTDEVKKIE
jgi:curli biogenesis system outer membrane secretion channel CsgG